MDEKSFLTANTYSSGSVLKIHDLFWYPTVKLPRKVPRKSKYNTLRVALCSRNFQNVKLRLDFVEIQSFYHHSDFTWNQILVISNGPKMLILTILEILIWVNLSNFQVPNLLKFKVQSLWNCQKWHFRTFWNHQNLISRKIWLAEKWSNFDKVKP